MELKKESNGSRMRMMDKNQKPSSISPDEYFDLFGKAMKKLAESVEKIMGEGQLLIYFEQLCRYQIGEIQTAVNEAIRGNLFSVIVPVGKLIRYIEDVRRERWEQYNPFQIEFKRDEISSERLRELLKPFRDKLAMAEDREREERELKWQKNKEKLQGQTKLVKLNADPVERK